MKQSLLAQQQQGEMVKAMLEAQKEAIAKSFGPSLIQNDGVILSEPEGFPRHFREELIYDAAFRKRLIDYLEKKRGAVHTLFRHPIGIGSGRMDWYVADGPIRPVESGGFAPLVVGGRRTRYITFTQLGLTVAELDPELGQVLIVLDQIPVIGRDWWKHQRFKEMLCQK